MIFRFSMAAFFLLASAFLSFGGVASDTPDTATAYLRAWSFKDYATMYALSGEQTRRAMSETEFFSAASLLEGPAGDPHIVSRSGRRNGETIYFEAVGSKSKDNKIRGSITVSPSDGVSHPELLGASTAVAKVRAAHGADQSMSIGIAGKPDAEQPTKGEKQSPADGETVDSVLDKMGKATAAAETLRADVQLNGSLMGQSVNETGTLVYKAPGKFRMQFNSFIMNADGQQSLLYMPQANVYIDMASLGGLELAPGIGTSVAELKEKYEISLRNKGEVNGQEAVELLMKAPGSSLGGMIGASGTMKMWVSTKTWLPVRVTMDSFKADYRNLIINAGGIDDGSFTFQPPKGATSLSLGGILGALSKSE